MRRLLCAGCSKVGQPGEGVKLDVSSKQFYTSRLPKGLVVKGVYEDL